MTPRVKMHPECKLCGSVTDVDLAVWDQIANVVDVAGKE